LFVVDLSTVMRKISDWKKLMPRIQPFYAVKCNDDVVVCRMLADSGCGFDCASKAEIQAALSYGISPDLIIYANPCKQASMLRYARSVGVMKLTADNVEELHKVAREHPFAEVVIRIAVDDSKSVCRFNSKFGAQPAEWDELLRTARALDLNVLGFSFHVGSGCGDLKPFADAVSSARDAFDLAATV
ncbi:ornithine decarboxylase 1, partial [Baffinella frigidus]